MTQNDSLVAAAPPETVSDLDRLDVPEVAVNGADYLADPHRVWKQARACHWLARTELGVNVLSYRANYELVRSRQLAAIGDAPLAMQGITDGLIHTYWTQGLLFTFEGERHDRLRRLQTHVFTPKMVDRLRPAMRSVAAELTEPFAGDGACDFVDRFAHRYPVEIIARLLGLPNDEIPKFERWSTDLALVLAFPVEPVRDRVEAAITGLFDYVSDVVSRRRRQPGDDFISELIAVEADGDRLTNDELVWQLVNLTFAGHDTTRSQIALLLKLFCEHPDEWRRLAADPSLAGNAVEEGMRLHPAAPATMRLAGEELVYGGVRFPAGTVLVLRADCANRDPEVFTDPDVFDITRPNAHQQVTFGGGAHYCLGAYLARAELEEALLALVKAMPGVRMDGPGRWRPYSAIILGPESMPVSFDVATDDASGLRVGGGDGVAAP